MLATFAPASTDQVVIGYDRLAPYYDSFTAGYDYTTWTDALEALAIDHGLRGRRLLDAACGTGKSFLPFLARGYRVTAFDLCPAMVAQAQGKLGSRGARLFVADMRALPNLGGFDLITCLDDSVNYLLSGDDLEAAFSSFARCLAADGLLVFDCNSRATYGSAFRAQFVRECEDVFFAWRGDPDPDDGLASATIDIFARDEFGWQRATSEHRQRYHSRTTIAAATAAAGLELVATRGQSPGGRLDHDVDEDVHTKVVYLARRS